MKIKDFHMGENSSEGPEFPSPGGMAKIQRIFDGVVKKNVSHFSAANWWLRDPLPIKFKFNKKAPIKPELMFISKSNFNYKILDTSLQSHSKSSRSSAVNGSTVWESISI
jgi:hypothetical protein